MKIKGFIPAVFTPFDAEGQFDSSIIPNYAERLKNEGVAGIFVGGTTGEGLLLTIAERKKIAEAWIQHQSDNFKVIIHVGATSIVDARDLASHAASHSAYAISAMAPLFLKPQSVAALIEFCGQVADAAPDLPFYYYHIPQITNVDFMMIDFLHQTKERIPTLAGIKYSGTNIMDVLLCAEHNNNEADIIYGQDEKLLAGLVFGLEGAIGSTYNYMTPHYHKLVKAFQEGNLTLARELQVASAELVRCMDRFGGGVRVGKRIMKAIGIDCGELRSPGVPITDDEWKGFQSNLRENGLDKYVDILPFSKPQK